MLEEQAHRGWRDPETVAVFREGYPGDEAVPEITRFGASPENPRRGIFVSLRFQAARRPR